MRLLPSVQGGLWKRAFEKARPALTRTALLVPAKKRRLPPFPRRIAVVTSPDGAALRDIQAVIGRRWPPAELLVGPAQVQGTKAEGSVCSALNLISPLPAAVLTPALGGGAIQKPR